MPRRISPTRQQARARTTAAVAVCTVILALAGCGAPGAPGTAPAADADDPGLSGRLTVAAAASLQDVVTEAAEAFTADHPDVAFDALTFDGSSVLATQIIGGAPVDVFASADERTMSSVGDAGLLAAEPVRFATSVLEIAVAPGNPLAIDSLEDLARRGADERRPTVVVCAAEVPCGSAAQQLLERDGVSLQPASEEQNVTAVMTKVASGEADAGLVYRSDVLRSAGRVEGVEIPGAGDAAGSYLIAPIAGSRSEAAARAFADSLLAAGVQSRLAELGFGTVDSP